MEFKLEVHCMGHLLGLVVVLYVIEEGSIQLFL